MKKLVKLSCPGCGASINQVEGKDYFFCTYCGSKVAADEEGGQLIKLKTKIIIKTETPMMDCESCSGTINLNEDKKYKCRTCGKVICGNCYDEEFNICESCLAEKKKADRKKNLPMRIAIYFIIAAIVILICQQAYKWFINAIS